MDRISDIIDDLEDTISELEGTVVDLERLRDRGEDGGKQAAIDAINQIRRGDYAEAITTLEREFMPKWQSTEHCQRDFIRSTGVDPAGAKVSTSGGGIGPY